MAMMMSTREPDRCNMFPSRRKEREKVGRKDDEVDEEEDEEAEEI